MVSEKGNSKNRSSSVGGDISRKRFRAISELDRPSERSSSSGSERMGAKALPGTAKLAFFKFRALARSAVVAGREATSSKEGADL